MFEAGLYAAIATVWCFIGAVRMGRGPCGDIGAAIFLSVIATLFALRSGWLLIQGMILKSVLP